MQCVQLCSACPAAAAGIDHGRLVVPSGLLLLWRGAVSHRLVHVAIVMETEAPGPPVMALRAGAAPVLLLTPSSQSQRRLALCS
jgi:hypothetical protein